MSRLEELEKRLEELRPARDEWQKLSFEADSLRKEKRKKDAADLMSKLEKETNFEICSFYDDYYSESSNGWADFKDYTQLEALCKALNQYYGYYKCFNMVKWGGPGRYVLTPSKSTDHDRDDIYTGTFSFWLKFEDLG